MTEKKEVSKRDDTKLLAISQVVAGILANEAMRDELQRRGLFNDIEETVVAEAFDIVQLIENNI